MADQDDLKRRIAALQAEHRDLDARIDELVQCPGVDQIRLQRLKKQKLTLRDEIARLASKLLPDIIA